MKLRLFLLVLLLCPSPSLFAQEGGGWNFSGLFQASNSSAGTILKLDPTIGYSFNAHVKTNFGLPVYFVNEIATSSSPGVVGGIGNANAGIRIELENPAVDFTSSLEFTAPTGNRDNGFS